jgi:O-antigen biosynthesis protein
LIPAEAIHHVPEILYHWRKSANSTALSQDTKGYAAGAGQRAVSAHLARRSLPGRAVPLNGTRYAVEWSFKEKPSISILVPFRDQADITRRCVDAVLAKTRYPTYEIVLVDNWSIQDSTRRYCDALRNEPRVRQVRIEEDFNYSRINNLAAATCASDYLLFLNNDVFIQQEDWLDRLVAEALADPAVGGVGAKLLYPNGTVQHAGVVLGVGGVADHAFRGLGADEPGYAFRAALAQQLSAVTAACLLCRAPAFREVGGFDEDKLKVTFNDVDLCLRLGQAGWKIIYTPSVVAEHHESLSRGSDMVPEQRDRFYAENQAMKDRWGALIADDPHYNPHFSRAHGIFSALNSKPPPPRA